MEPDQDTVQETKPGSVNTAVYLIIAAVLLGVLYAVINALLNWDEVARFYDSPFLPVCISFDYLFAIFLAYKIGQGRNWARILYVFGPLSQTANFVLNAAEYRSGLPLTLFPIAQVILGWNAIVLLFQSPAGDWFKDQKTSSERTLENTAAAQAAAVEPSSTIVDALASRLFKQPEQSWPMVKIVTVAGAVGAALSLINPILWTIFWSPHTVTEREMIYVQLIAGFIVGAAWGALGGAILLYLATKKPRRSPLNWAITGGILGGLLTFSCGFVGTILAIV